MERLWIFFLEHAEEDEAVPVGQGEASILINGAVGEICQRFWEKLGRESQRKSRSKVYHNACEMAKQIPAFRLHVSLDGRFWEEIEKVFGEFSSLI
jgi:SynChlorMet cassette protein ScmC